MRKLIFALIACLAVFGPAPWTAAHAMSQPVAVVPSVGDVALLDPMAESAQPNLARAVAESKILLEMLQAERNPTPDINTQNGGANKLADDHGAVVGLPLLC